MKKWEKSLCQEASEDILVWTLCGGSLSWKWQCLLWLLMVLCRRIRHFTTSGVKAFVPDVRRNSSCVFFQKLICILRYQSRNSDTWTFFRKLLQAGPNWWLAMACCSHRGFQYQNNYCKIFHKNVCECVIFSESCQVLEF